MSIFVRGRAVLFGAFSHPLIAKALLTETFIEHARDHDAGGRGQVAWLTKADRERYSSSNRLTEWDEVPSVAACGWRRAGAAALLAGAGLLAAACGSSGSSATVPDSSAAAAPGPLSASEGGNPVALLKTDASRLGTVLANGTGYTLYWFSQDTAASSACNNVCQNNWAPVTGRPKAAAGVSLSGKLGAFVRIGGATQATYDGHPLYTYAGDFEPGDAEGNGVYEYGGRWYAVTIGASRY